MGKQPSRTPAEAAASAAELLREATRAADFLTDGSLYDLADKAREAIKQRDDLLRDVNRQADEISRLTKALEDAQATANAARDDLLAELDAALEDAQATANVARDDLLAELDAAHEALAAAGAARGT